MSNARQSPIPEVYVLWHPHCASGEPLARRIYDWLRPGNGLGPAVFYRSPTAPGGPSGGLPLPLPGEWRTHAAVSTVRYSNLQIVLPLIDAHMVADPAWRHWLGQLSRSAASQSRIFMPVALDATAYNVPAPLRDLNFLRPSEPVAAAPAGDGGVSPLLVRSLLKQLTEALCRLMLGGRDSTGQQPASPPVADSTQGDGFVPKQKVFLSHAKADGMTPARRLRDYIYSQTQLAAFYDENDIAFGSVFAQVLDNDLTSRETAALIAVRSARYAGRPWCRREISLFRRPRPDLRPGSSKDRWVLPPTLVVDALEPGLQTVGIAELGNAPCIRWDEEVPQQEEQIVTTLLRDVMLGAFHAAVGATIPNQTRRIVINWVPDPVTLLAIDAVRKTTQQLHIVHPGRGLSGLELDTLEEFLPRLTFHSFEELLT